MFPEGAETHDAAAYGSDGVYKSILRADVRFSAIE
jgi:hypothetical protein